MTVEMKTPITPNDMIVKKLWKNFFFLTWNLPHNKKRKEKKNFVNHKYDSDQTIVN